MDTLTILSIVLDSTLIVLLLVFIYLVKSKKYREDFKISITVDTTDAMKKIKELQKEVEKLDL